MDSCVTFLNLQRAVLWKYVIRSWVIRLDCTDYALISPFLVLCFFSYFFQPFGCRSCFFYPYSSRASFLSSFSSNLAVHVQNISTFSNVCWLGFVFSASRKYYFSLFFSLSIWGISFLRSEFDLCASALEPMSWNPMLILGLLLIVSDFNLILLFY